jgi:uncharacterized protein
MPWMRRVLTLLAIGLAVLVLAVLGLRWLEPHLIYFPTGPVTQTPAALGIAFQDVTIPTEDGERLRAWWIPAEDGPPPADGGAPRTPALLFFHGNAGSREHRLHNLLGLHRLGVPVLIFDYRGYAGSSGTPSEAGLYRDGEAAFDWLRGHVGDRPIVLFGRSLGGAVAARVALGRPAAGLILESTFTTAREMARRVLPLPGIGYLMGSRYDVLEAVRRLSMPLLFIHGEGDEVVPFAMGQRLFAEARVPRKTFHAVPGGHHNDTYERAGDAYWEWIREFLESLAG